MKKILALMLAVLMVAGLFAGCAKEPATTPTGTTAPATKPTEPTPTEPTPTEPTPAIDQITVGTTSVIEFATRDEYAYDMMASAVSELPLVYQDASGNYHPLLASYETTDAKTWTYTIVEGMTWSDGTPVTAEDILFTLQYGDENGSANFKDQTVDDKTTAAKYEGYKLSDDKMSISLTLAAANVRELSNMTSFRAMPKHIYEGKTEVSDADKRIGCGPYMFESFNKEAGTVSFVVNPYYPAMPNVAKVVYKMFSNEDTMYMALTNGEIDFVWNYSTGVSANYQSILADAENVTLKNVPAANAPAVLAFNNANGPFADKALREAVSYALDYNAFKIYFGSPYAQTPNRGFVPSTTVGYKDTAALETNLTKAHKIMTDAGYAKNDKGMYADKDGNVVGFTLTVNGGKTAHVGYAELIKTNLQAFGIQVTIEALDGNSYNAKTSNKFSENNITMEAAIYGYTAAGMGMMNGLATIYVDGTHAVQGGAQVYDPAFQQIRDKMAAAKTAEEYIAAAGEMQDFYAANVPVIALYWDNMMFAHSAKYDGLVVDAVFFLNNVNTWFSIYEK